jgi:hypothetical protein
VRSEDVHPGSEHDQGDCKDSQHGSESASAGWMPAPVGVAGLKNQQLLAGETVHLTLNFVDPPEVVFLGAGMRNGALYE